MKIIIENRNNKLYPICPLAYAFCELMNGDNFTPKSIDIIKSMGYQIYTITANEIYYKEARC